MRLVFSQQVRAAAVGSRRRPSRGVHGYFRIPIPCRPRGRSGLCVGRGQMGQMGCLVVSGGSGVVSGGGRRGRGFFLSGGFSISICLVAACISYVQVEPGAEVGAWFICRGEKWGNG